MRPFLRWLAAWLAAGTLPFAAAAAEAEPAPYDAGAREALAVFAATWPASPATLPTTSGEVYLGNLDARIASLRAVASRSDDHRAAYAGALYSRYRLLGREADLAATRAQLAAGDPDAPALKTVRAAVLSGMHRFAEAERALGPRGASDEPFREIDLALGRYDRLHVGDPTLRQPGASFYDTAWRAHLRVLAGDAEGAQRLYRAAQSQYTDSSPVGLAWLYAQQGVAWLRFDRCADAEPFLRAAIERLPGYVLAEDHLAECLFRDGRLDAARGAYASLVERTGNPEFMGQLASIEAQAGNARAARQWQRRADRAWRRVLATDEAAYAQHAAEFYLKHGDAKRADALATRNLAIRADVLSLVLAARTAHALGDDARMQRHLDAARATRLAPPELTAFAAEVAQARHAAGATPAPAARRPAS